MRDYDPTTGRYLQADPLGLIDGASVYGYALQNPGRYTDPTGEFIPLLLGIALGVGLEYLTNPCATLQDLALAGALGAFGGAVSQATFLRYGARSLTRETGKEWSHSVGKKWVNKYTSGRVNRALNERGGWNGSWASPKRHYKHDPRRYPKGWGAYGDRYGRTAQTADRIPDWAKGTAAGSTIAAGIAGNECGCE